MKVQYCNYDDKSIIDRLTQLKTNINSKVVDVGGSMSSWSSPYVDMIVDISANTDEHIRIDICDETEWNQVLKYVKENGKFDFAICTHTLEDLYNPFVTLKNLPLIANAGVISMPSAYMELTKVEGDWNGYIHHRWIFDFDGENILVIPKIPALEYLTRGKNITQKFQEIRFFWENDVTYKIFMNNFLGPDIETVEREYSTFIQHHE